MYPYIMSAAWWLFLTGFSLVLSLRRVNRYFELEPEQLEEQLEHEII
jgi:hypothetical protein